MSVLFGNALWLQGSAVAAGVRQAASPTPPEVRVEAYQDVNVRAGPGTDYDPVGRLIRGQSGAILGRSPDSAWLKIVYIGAPDNTGWVFRDLVRVVGDVPSMATIIPPPTPTLPPTLTLPAIVPEGALTPTPDEGRLPTFTAPAPVIRPTLLPEQAAPQRLAVPPALVILVLFVLGTFGGLVSLLRSRN